MAPYFEIRIAQPFATSEGKMTTRKMTPCGKIAELDDARKLLVERIAGGRYLSRSVRLRGVRWP